MTTTTSRPGRAERWAIFGLLIAQLLVQWSLTRRFSPTADEPAHILSSYLYWQGRDNLPPRDVPPLMKMVGGAIPLLLEAPIPFDNAALWKDPREWTLAGEMMGRLNEEGTRRLISWSRLPFLLFPMGVMCLMWWWGRQVFGARVALGLCAAWVLEPTALGHGALFKNDIAASFGYLLFAWRAWRYWTTPTTPNAAWVGAGLLVALLTKMSMLVLLPWVVVLFAARSWRTPLQAVARLLLAGVVVYGGLMTAYQFEARPLQSPDLTPARPYIPRVLLAPLRIVPVPLGLWQGAVSLIASNRDSNEVYFGGRKRSPTPWYFAGASLVKTPLPHLALIVSGWLLALWRWKRLAPAVWFWMIASSFYFLLASQSNLQLGFRLVLPALAPALLVCGVVLRELLQGWTKCLVVGGFVWAGVSAVILFPSYIAHFNVLAGGPTRALSYLSDSNVDWGQDGWRLLDWIRAHPKDQIRVSYFGGMSQFIFNDQPNADLLIPPWSEQWAEGEVYDPQPGVYAISATLLTGQLFAPVYRDYYRRFRESTPVEIIGGSIFIYRF